MWKKIFACFLCCVLVAIPLVQRSYAAVTTITVVTVLILTLLTAMGISLVVADGTKESFLSDKGDAFMSAKGYSGSFADWISGGNPIDIGLKVGTLLVAKAVVDRCKEFISWLVPGAASNTVVDIASGSTASISSSSISTGTVNSSGRFVLTSYTSLPNGTYTNGEVTVILSTITASTNYRKFEADSGYNSISGSWFESPISQSQRGLNLGFAIVTSSFYLNGSSYLPGVYLINAPSGDRSTFAYIDRFFFHVSDVEGYATPNVGGQAIIGDYDDLSDLTTTTTEVTGGTTIINNTFYITQDGQALNPSGQSLDDIINALRQALESDKREVTVTGTTAATVAAGEAAPNYSDFQLGNLDLSGLGALLTTRFPFSIPWDLVRIFEVFVSDPEAPHWSVNLLPIAAFDGVDTTLDLDLGDYPIIGQVSRWFCIIDLCLGLVFATKKLIWTA